ncbi:MAG: hypothetical protein KAI45_02510, partial [Melioribacteraceae bacterium]|nr:hypothetical protein [Melioribacteraceae bacterium]
GYAGEDFARIGEDIRDSEIAWSPIGSTAGEDAVLSEMLAAVRNVRCKDMLDVATSEIILNF